MMLHDSRKETCLTVKNGTKEFTKLTHPNFQVSQLDTCITQSSCPPLHAKYSSSHYQCFTS